MPEDGPYINMSYQLLAGLPAALSPTFPNQIEYHCRPSKLYQYPGNKGIVMWTIIGPSFSGTTDDGALVGAVGLVLSLYSLNLVNH